MLVKQLNNIAQEVGKKKCSHTNVFYQNSICKKTLLQWFDTKIKSQNLEIDLRVKNQFERENPIN